MRFVYNYNAVYRGRFFSCHTLLRHFFSFLFKYKSIKLLLLLLFPLFFAYYLGILILLLLLFMCLRFVYVRAFSQSAPFFVYVPMLLSVSIVFFHKLVYKCVFFVVVISLLSTSSSSWNCSRDFYSIIPFTTLSLNINPFAMNILCVYLYICVAKYSLEEYHQHFWFEIGKEMRCIHTHGIYKQKLRKQKKRVLNRCSIKVGKLCIWIGAR